VVIKECMLCHLKGSFPLVIKGKTEKEARNWISSRYFRNHAIKLHLPMTVIYGHGIEGELISMSQLHLLLIIPFDSM